MFLSKQHMTIVAISGGLAILVGVPLGLWLSRPRMRRAAESIMQALNIGSTIPTLAVLALSMSLLGIGVVPAIFALVGRVAAADRAQHLRRHARRCRPT